MSSTDYDVVIASDLRFPGGTAASVAEEIAAQSRGGYTTGLLHVPSPSLIGNLPCNPKIRRCVDEGLADLIVDQRALRTRLLVLRHPSVFSTMPARWPRIEAGHRVLVVNQAPTDAVPGRQAYDVQAVHDTLGELLGDDIAWAPIGPLVRESVREVAPWRELLPDDWTNIIDVDEWSVDRSRPVSDRPVIGRHSRPSWKKWPARPEDLRAAYPVDGDVEVRILGGAEAAAGVLGHLPSAWTVYPYNSMPARRFLAEIDFSVYFHHTELVEAFGRATLEALASGAVCVLPEHFRVLFQDSCLYGTPQDVVPLVRRLHGDWDAYREQSARGQSFVRERFGAEAHQRRVAAIIGRGSGPPRALRRATAPDRSTPVLFVSSNGAGVGHLTRLMSMARRAPANVQPVFFTLSQAVSVVRRAGYPCEYFPSSGYTGMDATEWNDGFRERLLEVLASYRAAALVFDGTFVFQGLHDAAVQRPDVPFVWSRRGMWQEGKGNPVVFERGAVFALTIEPGDFAEEVDRGMSRRHRDRAVIVPPVVYLDESELLGREEACAALGLDPGRPSALVQLGAGNINDISSALDLTVAELSRTKGLQVAVTSPVIANRHQSHAASVVPVSVYPLSKYFRAFDFAIAAPGYNTYHELIGFGVPTLFVPNLETALDDQWGRARYAEQVGVGLCVEHVDPSTIRRPLEILLDPARRAEMRDRAVELFPGNGAQAAMNAVSAVLPSSVGGLAVPRDVPSVQAAAGMEVA